MTDRASPCRTPGAVYYTSIGTVPKIKTGGKIQVVRASVELPEGVRLDDEEAARLDERLHIALEDALAPLFNGKVDRA